MKDSALLVPVVSSKMLWKSLHWNVHRMLNEVFFPKFFECLMFIKSFWRLQHSSKDALLKFKLFARMKRKNLSLDEKMKVIGYANKNPKRGCWVIAEHFSIRKTYISNISTNAKLFKGNINFPKEIVKIWDMGNGT